MAAKVGRHLMSAENVRDRRAQPLEELSPSERSEDSAANRALRARIRRKPEAYKQEATQLQRLHCLGRRESVLSTYGISKVPFLAKNSVADTAKNIKPYRTI